VTEIRRLAILGFHKIGEPPRDGWETWFYIREARFAAYLGHLHENGYQVIDLAAFLGGLRAPDSLPERPVLLTFDDGYRSIRDVALPWLLRFGYPAVLFVPTDFIGGRNSFDAGNEPEEAICDWDDLQELERCSISIQSHGASHRSFSELDVVEQDAELFGSKRALESGLGKPVQVFAYPYGDAGADPQALGRALKRAGYRAAFLFGGSPNPLPITDPYHLARLAIGPDTDLQAALAAFQ
jgi:peptidoglycan/xylan/chitin deacetylase (PgdA/CDA1 family)